MTPESRITVLEETVKSLLAAREKSKTDNQELLTRTIVLERQLASLYKVVTTLFETMKVNDKIHDRAVRTLQLKITALTQEHLR